MAQARDSQEAEAADLEASGCSGLRLQGADDAAEADKEKLLSSRKSVTEGSSSLTLTMNFRRKGAVEEEDQGKAGSGERGEQTPSAARKPKTRFVEPRASDAAPKGEASPKASATISCPSPSSEASCAAATPPRAEATRSQPSRSVLSPAIRAPPRAAATIGSEVEVEAATHAVVRSIRAAAAKLEADCQKFPRSGKGFFSTAQDRFIAAIPLPGDGAPGAAPAGDEAEVQCWRRGQLAYWANRAAFLKRMEAKGHIDLASIVKVHWDTKTPKEVSVSYLEEGETFDLVLSFSRPGLAEEWALSLRQLQELLQRC